MYEVGSLIFESWAVTSIGTAMSELGEVLRCTKQLVHPCIGHRLVYDKCRQRVIH